MQKNIDDIYISECNCKICKREKKTCDNCRYEKGCMQAIWDSYYNGYRDIDYCNLWESV